MSTQPPTRRPRDRRATLQRLIVPALIQFGALAWLALTLSDSAGPVRVLVIILGVILVVELIGLSALVIYLFSRKR